eukprot:scaffold7075_cov274-Pinguiococcus_pyrenoidosus.AAC.20
MPSQRPMRAWVPPATQRPHTTKRRATRNADIYVARGIVFGVGIGGAVLLSFLFLLLLRTPGRLAKRSCATLPNGNVSVSWKRNARYSCSSRVGRRVQPAWAPPGRRRAALPGAPKVGRRGSAGAFGHRNRPAPIRLVLPFRSVVSVRLPDHRDAQADHAQHRRRERGRPQPGLHARSHLLPDRPSLRPRALLHPVDHLRRLPRFLRRDCRQRGRPVKTDRKTSVPGASTDAGDFPVLRRRRLLPGSGHLSSSWLWASWCVQAVSACHPPLTQRGEEPYSLPWLQVVALAVATFYFSRNKNREVGNKTVFSSLRLVLLYHVGTAAFGSLVIAIIKTIRSVVTYLQKKAKKSKNKIAEYLLCILQCCMWCVEKCMKFINKNAYIQTAIFSYSFCTAARKAFFLILRNLLRIAAVSLVGEFVIFLGKVVVPVATTVVAYLAITGSGMDDDLNGKTQNCSEQACCKGMGVGTVGTRFMYDSFAGFEGLVGPLLFVFLLAYLIALMFHEVFGMAIATIFQCFVADEEMFSNPNDRFAEKDLANLVGQCLPSSLNESSSKQKIWPDRSSAFRRIGKTTKAAADSKVVPSADKGAPMQKAKVEAVP